MGQHLKIDELSPYSTISVPYPAIPIHCRLSLSYPSINSQGYWLPNSTHSDFDSKFKNEISKLYNNEGYHDSVAEIDWKIYDKNNRISISDAVLLFVECMHYSLEEKLNRTLNTLNEVIYYAMPYWNKLPNDEKKGWIRRAEAEKKIHHNSDISKYREKFVMEQFDDDNKLKLNSDQFPTQSFQHFPFREEKARNVNQLLFPAVSVLDKKGKNSISNMPKKIHKIFDRFSGEYKIKDGANKLSSPDCWWTYLTNRNRKIGSRGQYYSDDQLFRISSVISPLRIKEQLTWNDNHNGDNHTYSQLFVPVSQL